MYNNYYCFLLLPSLVRDRSAYCFKLEMTTGLLYIINNNNDDETQLLVVTTKVLATSSSERPIS